MHSTDRAVSYWPPESCSQQRSHEGSNELCRSIRANGGLLEHVLRVLSRRPHDQMIFNMCKHLILALRCNTQRPGSSRDNRGSSIREAQASEFRKLPPVDSRRRRGCSSDEGTNTSHSLNSLKGNMWERILGVIRG